MNLIKFTSSGDRVIIGCLALAHSQWNIFFLEQAVLEQALLGQLLLEGFLLEQRSLGDWL
jgi:hypothetical protein